MTWTFPDWLTVPIVLGAVWALYVQLRESQLKRTEYLIELWQVFHNDPDLVECICIAEGRHPTVGIDAFCSIAETTGPLSDADLVLFKKFEKFLSFLATLAFAHRTQKSLTASDLGAFGYWFECVVESKRLSTYCNETGYEDIVLVWPKIRGKSSVA